MHSQTNAAILRNAEQSMRDKDWYGAAQHYDRLYDRDSSELSVKFGYAEASRLNFDLDLSLRLYSKVVLFDDERKYPMSYFWIGQLYKYKGNYKEAKKWFAKFSKLKFKKNKKQFEYYVAKAKMEMDACDLAQVLLKNPSGPKPEHLDTTINSKLSEYAPFEMDSILYFSSLKNPHKKDPNEISYNKIYRSQMKNLKWQKVKALDTNINSSVIHNANTCFSPDFQTMIISRCKAKNGSEYLCELFQSKWIGGKWQLPEKLPEPINIPGTSNTQPCFGEIKGSVYLFFASDRAGGSGGLDIWYSEQQKDGSFQRPVNCGTLLNTPEDDITPWFVNERKTLYFSSTYHKGLGGFDIFMSKFNDTVFTAPENVGFPINSSYNDVYYSVNKSRDRAYLSSNRSGSFFEGKLNCCNDIYRFSIEPLSEPPKPIDTLAIEKGKLKLLCPITLYFHNDEPDPKTKNTSTAKNYEATYKEYKFLMPEYLNEYPKGKEAKERSECKRMVEDFFADSVDAGMEDLRKFSDIMQQVLIKGETVRITMKGYCSPLASTDYNVNLAKRRISSLRNYFLETKDGWFARYVNKPDSAGGRIIFEDVGIGELMASRVSDDLKDKRNSVYSPYAARERKIQIIAVGFE